MAAAGFGNMPGDAFADMVRTQLLFALVKSPGGFDFQGVINQEGKSAAQHPHALFQDVQNFLKQDIDIPLMDDDLAYLLYHRNFR